MSSVLNHRPYFYIFKPKAFLLTALFFVMHSPVMAQNPSGKQLCRAFENELRNISQHTQFTHSQAKRFHELMLMQEQAEKDIKRYSCYPDFFSKASVSQACSYINTSYKSIETALNQLSRQSETSQQKHLKQKIYINMRHYNCRSLQSLNRIIQENKLSSPLKRSKQGYLKKKTLRQNARLQPAIIDGTSETIPQTTDITPVKAVITSPKPSYSIFIEQPLQTKKTAENTPPPVYSEPVDYVPDPTIRRVGPTYWPDQ